MALSAAVTVLTADSTAASAVIQDLTYTAVELGSAGNSISITYEDPGDTDQSLSVSVLGDAITVSLATDSGGDITSTADDILAAIQGDSDASALVSVEVSGTGSNVQTAQLETFLEGGGTSAAYNQKLVAVVVVSSDAGAVTLQTAKPMVISTSDTLASNENTSVVLGPDPVPSINPIVVPASGSTTISFPLVFLAPSAPSFQLFGQSTLSYDVSCQIQGTNGSIILADPATVTISPIE